MISANEYFDGNVSTVGVMEAGEYKFDTSAHETMIVVEGALIVQLPEATEWLTFKTGEQFEVEAHTSFLVKVQSQTSYLCKYK